MPRVSDRRTRTIVMEPNQLLDHGLEVLIVEPVITARVQQKERFQLLLHCGGSRHFQALKEGVDRHAHGV